jgi:hypothetical protein
LLNFRNRIARLEKRLRDSDNNNADNELYERILRARLRVARVLPKYAAKWGLDSTEEGIA